ncbi:benzoate/H(+) symporter BenE family transporter [Limnohabitans sp. Rim8]|uniref:benzoate/H(+) symporter BenE family transporter n=1 Tax=Limnohabitans sp. Rim8 TaxID=1100718 RepID=UPI0025EDA9AE|nr:benzoate/H(+) symporter BenE family transporter [Limnohabitans sp. Rim8]
MRRVWRDFSLSTVVAGFVAVLVGFTSSAAIVFSAAQALGATPEQMVSWMWALGIGMGTTSLGLSLWYRQPVLTAWSTPGAAVLAVSQGVSLPEATGAFMVCALLIMAVGYSGWFERLMSKIPLALASALLAGVLARFALDAVKAVAHAPVLVLAMTLAYLLGRRWWPRWSVPMVLLVGMGVAVSQGQLHLSGVDGSWATPVWVSPTWRWAAMVSVALPLFVVTMASQNMPGVAAQRASGFNTPVSPVVGATGLASLVLAPFGGYALNLAAITAAICMGKEAHPDPGRRYTASAAAGLLYIALGLAGGTIVSLMAAFPQALVMAVAGLALLGTMASGLAVAVKDEQHREAALLTFLVTVSGVTLAGVGSAFWGVVVGGLAQWLWTRRPTASH